ncbi:MAG: DNA translocase FtsK 4TM domain-containing protein, partial [Bacteroidia bacterium]
MAIFKKKTAKKGKRKAPKEKRDNTLINKIIGGLLLLFSVFVFLASVGYMFSWRTDQSILSLDTAEFIFEFNSNPPSNFMGKLGAFFAHLFIFNGFGIGAFLLYPIFFIIGYNLYFNNVFKIRPKTVSKLLITALWVSLVCALVFSKSYSVLSGLIGYGVFLFSKSLVGTVGMVLVLTMVTLLFLYVAFSIDVLETIRNKKILKRTNDEDIFEEGNTVSPAFGTEESLFEKDNIAVG